MDSFSKLDLDKTALLLDVDGTLIEIGSTPHDVHVPDALRALLASLSARAGGALALVSGRPIVDLDRMFAPLKLSLVGGHGAEMRVDGGGIQSAAEPLPDGLRKMLGKASAPDAGIIVEDKGYSLALHFRGAPQEGERLRALVAQGCAAYPAESVDVLPGKSMVEVKRAHIDKGNGVRALMQLAPFAGRTPVFIGDDVTDESVFAVLPELGGAGFSVGRRFAGLAGMFETPDDVRNALQRLAANGSGAGTRTRA